MRSFTVSFPGLGIEDLAVNRVIFEFSLFGREISIYWYGLLIAFAFGLGLYLSLRDAEKFRLSADDILDVFLLVIPLAIVGARAYYLVFSPKILSYGLLEILNISDGGLAFYGGVLGGILGIFLMSKYKKINFSHYTDFFAPYLALGHAIGRWGNFFNQEAFGRPTDLPWGMKSEGTLYYLLSLGHPTPDKPVHPTFLYESLANIIIFILLLRVRKNSKIRFGTTACYFAMYGLLRSFTESLRMDSLYIDGTGIRISQALSLLMFVTASIYLLFSYSRLKRIPPAERISAFERPISASGEEDSIAENSNCIGQDGSVEDKDKSETEGEDTFGKV